MRCDEKGSLGECSSLLDVAGLVFGYTSDLDILKDVNIEAGGGEFIALMGPNGSGKTTLMRCINKILQIKGGSVVIDGNDVKKLGRGDISKLCTTVPADIPPDFSLTAREFVMLGRSPYVVSWWWESEEDAAIVEKAMWDFGILHYSDRKLHELSSGERARALLAKGVVQRPKLMMVDEPSAHLDIKYKIQVMEMLKGLSRSGLTVIMASHDLNLVTRYCDKVMLLSEGEIISYGRPVDVVTKESIMKVFQIDVKVILDEGVPYIIPNPPSAGEEEFRVEL
ncbi:MAG: ABC transporter ATP-binding protein [Candidatus Methanoplasma sp.]|jgi:iron complex transport system ATP-binding protein|nr:ABC transporter ATP-binding protein [Candidatus Methanoplasma sp.]